MKIVAVDDEYMALERLTQVLQSAQPEAEIKGFKDPAEMLEYIESSAADAIFMDIELYGVSGIELARQISRAQPRSNIIFVTGHSQYALEAFGISASGYLTKPVRQEDVERELENLRYPPVAQPASAKRVRVQTFGNFEVFVDGQPLVVKRGRSKELLAYLVDRRGARCTMAELVAVLWEDKLYSASLYSQLRQLISDLAGALRARDAAHILIRGRNTVAVDPEELECDYYHFLKGESAVINSYAGEYMSNYSWAEPTTGFLSTVQDREREAAEDLMRF